MLRLSSFYSDVLHSVINGLTTALNSSISATDTIISALGKLQAQITDLKNNQSVSLNVTASGSSQNTATLLTSNYNNITSATSNTGVIVPSTLLIGSEITIWNNTIIKNVYVYPPSGAKINSIVVNGGFQLGSLSSVTLVIMSNTLLLSK